MKNQTSALTVARFVETFVATERGFCQLLNRVENRHALSLFRSVSRLGDGPIWIAQLLLLFALDPRAETFGAAGHLLAVAAVSICAYKLIKHTTARARPCMADAGIRQWMAPLDHYSFPSGHTLHAVAFTLVIVHYQPVLVWLPAPFTVLVALSRVVLGLHYPTDVAAGAGLGASIAHLSFLL